MSLHFHFTVVDYVHGTPANEAITDIKERSRFPTVLKSGYNKHGEFTIVLTHMGTDLFAILDNPKHKVFYEKCRLNFEVLVIQIVM